MVYAPVAGGVGVGGRVVLVCYCASVPLCGRVGGPVEGNNHRGVVRDPRAVSSGWLDDGRRMTNDE